MDEQTTISRREFLKVSAAAGMGLVISIYLSGCKRDATATPPPTATSADSGQAVPGPSPTPTPISLPDPTAWFEPSVYVQIDSVGRVTVTASRMEMGQGVRTALAMILAEELEADWATIGVETAQGRHQLRPPAHGGQSQHRAFIHADAPGRGRGSPDVVGGGRPTLGG